MLKIITNPTNPTLWMVETSVGFYLPFDNIAEVLAGKQGLLRGRVSKQSRKRRDSLKINTELRTRLKNTSLEFGQINTLYNHTSFIEAILEFNDPDLLAKFEDIFNNITTILVDTTEVTVPSVDVNLGVTAQSLRILPTNAYVDLKKEVYPHLNKMREIILSLEEKIRTIEGLNGTVTQDLNVSGSVTKQGISAPGSDVPL